MCCVLISFGEYFIFTPPFQFNPFIERFVENSCHFCAFPAMFLSSIKNVAFIRAKLFCYKLDSKHCNPMAFVLCIVTAQRKHSAHKTAVLVPTAKESYLSAQNSFLGSSSSHSVYAWRCPLSANFIQTCRLLLDSCFNT